MSYRTKHVRHKVSRIKRPKGHKKSFFKRLWFWIIILILIIFSLACYFLFFYQGFWIKNVQISGNDKVKTHELQQIILNNIHTSIFLIDKNALRQDILDKFPVIEKISIKKDLPQTLILGVTERKPLGVFCANDDKCYLIDSNGIIFEQLSAVQTNVTVVRQTFNNAQVFTGEQVIAQNIIDAIYSIKKNLKDNFNIELAEALVTSSLRLDTKTSEGWRIYFDLETSSSVDSQLAKLGLLLNGGMSAGERANLKYVDLRPKDRAIICANSTCGG